MVLSDIRVLDLGRFIACPYCCMILADMGAEVIRIERPGGEDDRSYGLVGPHGENFSFTGYARNKKAITLNLIKNDKGQEVLDDLIRVSDVVAHNFSPDAAVLMGLTYERVKSVKPDIIFTAISSYGTKGPYAKRVGFDSVAQAMSGAMSVCGYPDVPIKSCLQWVDYSTGLSAVIGTLLALRHRDKTGEGQMVDLALLKTAISLMAPMIAEVEVLGIKRPRIVNRIPYIGSGDLFKCKDGMVLLTTVTDSLWRRLLRTIGQEELLGDPDFDTDYKRYLNRDRIDPKIAEWTAERTVNEVIDIMEKARIPCDKYMETDEISKDPHVKENKMLEYIDLGFPGVNEVPVCITPINMSETPGGIRSTVPRVGEHNTDIYSDLLGYSEERIAELKAQKAI